MGEQPQGKSLSEITDLLNASSHGRTGVENGRIPPGGTSEDTLDEADPALPAVEAESAEVDDPASADEFDLQSDEDQDEDEAVSADETDEADEPTQKVDDSPYLEVTDDDLIEVKIDGKVEYRTVGEAKKALSGAGAIETRIKEAAEARNTANAERAEGLRLMEQQRGQLVNAVTQLEQHLFPPAVAPPDQALRASNPQQYIIQDSDYRADQQRIAQSKAQLVQNLQEQQRQQQENFASYRGEQEKLLVQKIPGVVGEGGREYLGELSKSAAYYGFTADEISTAADHRIFVMADDARKYRELIAKKTVKTAAELKKDDVKPAVRRLRSGVARKRMQASTDARKHKSLMEKARKSGKSSDVLAAMMNRAQ